MKKGIFTKRLVAVLFFLLGSWGCIHITYFLDQFLRFGTIEIDFINLTKLKETMSTSPKAWLMLILLECIIIVLVVIYYKTEDDFYSSDLIEITPDVKIPRAAGQRQFGSARFLNEKEKENLFTTLTISAKDTKIKELLGLAKEELAEKEKLDGENTAKLEEIKKEEEIISQDEEEESLDETKIDKETGEIKESKYKIEDLIKAMFKEDDIKRNDFLMMVESLDAFIGFEKEKQKREVEEMLSKMVIEKVQNNVIEEIKRLNESTSFDIEDEIAKIKNKEAREELEGIYKRVTVNLDNEIKKYKTIIKDELNILLAVDASTDLNDSLRQLNRLIDKVNMLYGNEKNDLTMLISEVTEAIYTETERRNERLKDMLR